MTAEVKSEETQMERVEVPEETTVAAGEESAKIAADAAEAKKKEEEEPKSESKEETYDYSSPAVEKSLSFKEESNFLSDLKEAEKKALIDLKAKVEEAILKKEFFKPKHMEEKKEKSDKKEVSEKNGQEKEQPKVDGAKQEPKIDEEKEDSAKEEAKIEVSVEEIKEVSIWGVPLLPSKCLESTDVVLLKFLRAREFKVNEAFEMLRNTVQWREELKLDSILEEDFGTDLNSVAYMNGTDREGHPVCYNIYGVFEDKELYQRTFETEEKREQFLRWRFQVMEKGIKKLNFKPGGVSSILQITDLKNSPGLSKKELRLATKKAVGLLQDNYPEFVARNIFVNVPFWYYAFSALLSPFLTQRTKSKFLFVRPAKVTETLLKYIPAEDIPIQYGGLKREKDEEFLVEEGGITELVIKAGSTETVEIPVPEVGTTILWDITVLGWDVKYKEEFVPIDEGSYTIIIQKAKKMGSQEEPVRNSFRNNEPGKVLLMIENSTHKKKKILFRSKVKSVSDS